MTLIAAVFTARQVDRREDQALDERAEAVVETIDRRIETYTEKLFGVRGQFTGSQNVTHAEYETFLARQEVSRRVPRRPGARLRRPSSPTRAARRSSAPSTATPRHPASATPTSSSARTPSARAASRSPTCTRWGPTRRPTGSTSSRAGAAHRARARARPRPPRGHRAAAPRHRDDGPGGPADHAPALRGARPAPAPRIACCASAASRSSRSACPTSSAARSARARTSTSRSTTSAPSAPSPAACAPATRPSTCVTAPRPRARTARTAGPSTSRPRAASGRSTTRPPRTSSAGPRRPSRGSSPSSASACRCWRPRPSTTRARAGPRRGARRQDDRRPAVQPGRARALERGARALRVPGLARPPAAAADRQRLPPAARAAHGNELKGRAREYVEYALRGTRQMSTLIEDLLTYSRAGRNDRAPQPVNLDVRGTPRSSSSRPASRSATRR